MRAIRIGAVGLGFPSFDARTEKIWERSSTGLKEMAIPGGVDLVLWNDLVETVDGSQRAARYLDEQKIDFLLVQASSFSLGDVLYPLLSLKKRTGFWFVPEPRLEGELPLNSLTGFNLAMSICRKYAPSLQTKWFFGMPGDPSFDEPFHITLQALRAVAAVPGSRVGQIGDVVPTFDNLAYRSGDLREALGVEVVPVPVDELFDGCRNVPRGRINDLVRSLKHRAARVLVSDEWLEKTARVIGALHMIKEAYRLDAAAVRCWPEFQSRMNMAPCAALAHANDNGFPAGCEGDLMGTVSMLIASLITGSAPTMNDPVAFDAETDTVQMWHCGPGPASWADDEGQTLAYHHTLNRRRAPGAEPVGVSSDISFRKGAVTVMRLENDGKQLLVFEAEVVKGPGKAYLGSGGWFGNLTSDKRAISVRDFIETMGAYGVEHHYPVCRGHVEHVYREMAAWMGVEVLAFKRWKPYKQLTAHSIPPIIQST